MRRPLLALAACLLVGCLCPLASPASVPWVLGLVAVALVLVFWSPSSRPVPWALAVCAIAAGSAGRAVEDARYDEVPLRRWVVAAGDRREPVLVRGVLARDPDESGGRWVLTIDVEELRRGREALGVAGRARIVVDGEAARPRLVAGQRVAAWARLSMPRAATNPGGFDREAHARRRGVHATGFCKSPLLIASEDSPWTFALVLGRARERVRHGIVRHVEGDSERAVTRAMVLGDRAGLDDEVEEAFRMAGTYHVLALSGAQVALVAGLFVGLLRLLRSGPLTTAVVASVAVGAYALFVGADPPVTRAAWMASVLLFGRAAGLGGEAANLLGFVGVLLLALRPSAAADPSFQLSFAATLGIILWTRPVAALVRRLPSWLALPLAASVAAQVSLAPLIVWHFHRLAPAALLLNLAAVPLSSAVLLGGAAAAMADILWPAVAGAAGWVTTVAATGLLASSHWAEWLPGAHLRLPDPSGLAVAAWVATLVALSRRRHRWALVWCVLALGAFIVGAPPPGDGRLHVTALDVGDGDAFVLRSPTGRTWVVDAAGGRPGGVNLGEGVVAAYLWRGGVAALDRVTISHNHRDHAGGVPALLRAFWPGTLIQGPERAGEPDELDACAHGWERRRVCDGSREAWDGVDVSILWPPCPPRYAPQAENDASLVMRLRHRDVTILMTGDVSREVERSLPHERIDVLKVAHHGRRTSSSASFLHATRPVVAMISVGRHGSKGPPDPGILAELGRNGVRALRTDEDGAFTVSTDGTRVWLRREREPYLVFGQPPRFGLGS